VGVFNLWNILKKNLELEDMDLHAHGASLVQISAIIFYKIKMRYVDSLSEGVRQNQDIVKT
jgi:hypothetical protein